METREIKFRAFDDGKMLHSHNNYFNDDTTQLAWFFGKVREDSIIMQFTGLTDKNGKDIYEGDIISERWLCEVYKNVEGTFMIKFHTNPKVNKTMTLKKYLAHRLNAGTSEIDNSVIGNIHENQELI